MNISLKNAIGDLFKTEKGWMTLLLMTVCQLIPIVGPIVVLGYMIRRFASVRSGLGEPDFQFDFFGEYLQIGLWPFLASLVVGLVAIPLVLIGYSPLLIIAIDPNSKGLVTFAIVLTILLFAVMILLLMMLSFPVILRSGLMMDFKAGFSKTFIVDFSKKVGVSLVLWIWLLTLISIIPIYLGVFALIVGFYFVATIAGFAQFHLVFQHYDLYLERGGEKIAINPEVLKSSSTAPPLPQTGHQEQG